jgi:hypothetical protein
MGYGPSSCPRCGDLTNFYPELYDDTRPLCKSCECDDLKAELAALKAKLDYIEGQPTCRVGDVLADMAREEA